MPAPAALARVTAGLVLAEFAVHETRNAVTGAAGPHVHGAHLAVLTGPVVGMLSAALLAHVLLRAAVAPQRMAPRATRLRLVWPLATLAVLVLFVGQEAVEAVLSHHHQSLAETVSGAWAALPAAVVAGALLALAVGVTGVVASAPRPGSSLLQRFGPFAAAGVPVAAAFLAEAGLGRPPDRLCSGRAPPSAAPFPLLAVPA